MAIKRALQEEFSEAARERQRAGGRDKASGNFPEAERGQARDKVGEFAGASGRTIEKAEAIVEAAEKEPENVGLLTHCGLLASVSCAHATAGGWCSIAAVPTAAAIFLNLRPRLFDLAAIYGNSRRGSFSDHC